MTFGEKLRNYLKAANLPAVPAEQRADTWVKAVNEFVEVERPLVKAKRKQTPIAKMTDAEFWTYLETEPSLVGIDLNKEKGKCLFWCKNNAAQFTRRRFINWLNKADKTLSNHGRDADTRRADAAERSTPVPHGWQEFMKQKQREWQEKNGSQYDPPGAHAIAKDDFWGMPKDWRDECRRELGDAA